MRFRELMYYLYLMLTISLEEDCNYCHMVNSEKEAVAEYALVSVALQAVCTL